MDVLEELNPIFRMVFDDAALTVTRETTADDVEGWDSLAHSVLIVAVENHFKITFTQKDLLRMQRVGDMVDCICSKLGNG
jgi:acyl carrier protein